MRSELTAFAKRQIRRTGFDIVRHPSSHFRSGHTALVIDQMDVDVVIDVGANTGQYGQFLRSIGFRGQIISFEPVASVASKLAKIAANDGNWRVVPVALGSEDGEATINVTRASVMSSLRVPSTSSRTGVGEDIHVTRHETVPVRRLDSIFDEHVPPESKVFLKMAVQGWDLEVLAGASGCLSRVVAIQSIISIVPLYVDMPDWLDSLRRIRDLGFVPTGLFPVLNYGDLHVVEFDAIMVRPISP